MKKDWCAAVKPIMKKAGEILLSFYRTPLERKEKEGNGFVTQADLASETFLIKELALVLPEASFFAEESGRSGNSEYCWVIDPLDGTTNFAHGLPYFCISVALTHKNVPLLGAIYCPITDEFFFAEQGGGALVNDKPIAVSSPERFDKAMVAIGLPYGRVERAELIHAAESIAEAAYAIRHFGAIALDLAYVSCGRMDGVFFTHLAWWDVAAGMCIIKEAGGIITDFAGKEIEPDYSTCVAGGKMVHDQVMNLLAK